MAAVAFSKKEKTFKAETLYRMSGQAKLVNYFSGKCLLSFLAIECFLYVFTGKIRRKLF